MELDGVLTAIVDRLGRRLRGAHRVCRTVVLRLRFADFTRATRSHTMHEATGHTETILAAARGLLSGALPKITESGITLLGVSLTNLHHDLPVQLALPFTAHSGSALDDTLDSVRERFGTGAVSRARLIGHDHGHSVPLLPDD